MLTTRIELLYVDALLLGDRMIVRFEKYWRGYDANDSFFAFYGRQCRCSGKYVYLLD